MWNWIRRHPLIGAAICFLVFDAPQWVSATWSLFSAEPLVPWLRTHNIPHPQIAFSPWFITAPLGAGMFGIVLWALFSQRRTTHSEKPLTGLRLRNESDKRIESGKALRERLVNTVSDDLINDARNWLNDFERFAERNFSNPISNYDRLTYFRKFLTPEASDPGERSRQYQRAVGYCYGNLSILRNKIGDEVVVPPERFQVRCGPDLTSTNIWGGQRPVRFLHAEIQSNSGTVHGCRAYLTRINADRTWDGSEQLTFSPSESHDSLSKAIHQGIPYRLDVLAITADGEIHVCNEKRDWRSFPRLRELFGSRGFYYLTVAIGGEEVHGETFSIGFDWTGNWQDSFLTTVTRL